MLSFSKDTRTSITGGVAAAIDPANNASLAEKALRRTAVCRKGLFCPKSGGTSE